MYSSENAGLVKFDLLGLKTLTVIDKTLKRLKSKKIDLDITKIDLNDKKVFTLLSSGETTELFQLESAGMRDAIIKMKPIGLMILLPLLHCIDRDLWATFQYIMIVKMALKNQTIYTLHLKIF